MGSSALLSIGTRAMFANYAALQTTGNNIANANTRGYSRQSVDLETAGGQFTGAGFFGKGVNVSTVQRAHDQFLTREAQVSRALASSDAARADQLTQLEKVFGTGETGIGHVAGQLLNAFVDVASRPQDLSARQVVLARAQDVANRFAAAGQQLDTLQAGVTTDIKGAVSSVNALAQRIATLNGQIASVKGSGHTPNDLMDQRDQAISDLSQYVQVSTVGAEDGSINVFIGGGQRLVLSSNASQMVAMPDPYDPQMLRVGIQDAGSVRELSNEMLSGGSLSGLMRFQQNDLVDARNMLGQMATAISAAVNNQQSLGRDLSTPGVAGANMFQVGMPRSLAAATNTGSAQFAVSVTDASQAKASDYELRYDGVGYQLSRVGSTDMPISLSPGQLAAGYTVQGVTIRYTGGAPATGDRFLLQPMSAAARDMKMVLADPKGIAAASPVLASVPNTNTGTMTAGALTVKGTIADPAPEVMVRFDFQAGTNSYTYSFSTDGGATYGAGTPLVPGRPITYSSGGNTTWELQVNGVPADGDTLSVGAGNFTKSNNGNANALVALRDALLIDGATITDRYADTLSQIGVRVQSATSAAELSQSIAEQAELARSSQSGVNLDEEAARLMQFQQSYQAAAKMLQVAQSVFDTLLQAAAR